MLLMMAINAFRDLAGTIALLATLFIVYGTAMRTPIPAWVGLSVWALLFGDAVLRRQHEPIQAQAKQVISDGACIEQGTTTFCHELRHGRTTRTMIPPAAGSFGPPVVTLGFEFEGRRSCRSAEGEVVADFRLAMHGISEPVVADYPDLMAQVLPSPAELERYRIGDLVDIILKPQTDRPVDPAAIVSMFGVDGTLFPDGSYVTTEYVPVAESFGACLAQKENDGE